ENLYYAERTPLRSRRSNRRRRCLPQICRPERLLKHRRMPIPLLDPCNTVAGGEEVRNAAALEQLGDREAPLARQIHIEHRGVELGFRGELERGRQAAGEAGDLVAKVEQHVLDVHRDQHLVLDDQDAQGPLSHDPAPGRAPPRSPPRSCSVPHPVRNVASQCRPDPPPARARSAAIRSRARPAAPPAARPAPSTPAAAHCPRSSSGSTPCRHPSTERHIWRHWCRVRGRPEPKRAPPAGSATGSPLAPRTRRARRRDARSNRPPPRPAAPRPNCRPSADCAPATAPSAVLRTAPAPRPAEARPSA